MFNVPCCAMRFGTDKAHGTNALSNGTIPDPLRPPLPQDGVRKPTQKPITPMAIISGTGEATDFKFGQNIHRVHSNKNPLQILEKRERGRIQGLPNFWYPNYLRNGWSYGLQIWQVHSQDPSEQKHIKHFGEKGAWAYPGTARHF